MNKLSLAFTVGSLGSLFLGLTQGCSTNEAGNKGRLLPDAGDASAFTPDTGVINSSVSPFGRPCLSDNECGGRGVTCLIAGSHALLGGGPPNGTCSADCSTDQTACGKIDPNAICVTFSQTPREAYCFESCMIGPIATGDVKCHRRLDVACDRLTNSAGVQDPTGAGFCKPECRNDVDCGSRKCDLSDGLCKDAKDIVGTLPVGSPCDAGLTRDPCMGFCLPLTQNDAGTGPGWCTGLCPIGSLGCDSDPTSKTPPAAACLFGSATADQGDVGICAQLCDCNDDCKVAGRSCLPFSAAEVTSFGRAGYCGSSIDQAGKVAESIPCSGHKDAGSPHPDAGKHTEPADAGRDAR